MIEPEVFIHDTSGEDSEVVSLVEVEEFPTHPPFSRQVEPDLSEQVTEQDVYTRNPDGPVLTVPNASLRNTDVVEEESATDSDEDLTL